MENKILDLSKNLNDEIPLLPEKDAILKNLKEIAAETLDEYMNFCDGYVDSVLVYKNILSASQNGHKNLLHHLIENLTSEQLFNLNKIVLSLLFPNDVESRKEFEKHHFNCEVPSEDICQRATEMIKHIKSLNIDYESKIKEFYIRERQVQLMIHTLRVLNYGIVYEGMAFDRLVQSCQGDFDALDIMVDDAFVNKECEEYN